MTVIDVAEGESAYVVPYDTGLDPDDPASVFDLLAQGRDDGIPGALLTITGITGGAPRSLGAQMAVLADGRYCGYVSGGCVESAVASEAIRAIGSGRDETLRFGIGSPFVDIRLPCGGSIDIHVHVTPSEALIDEARALIAARGSFVLAFEPTAGTAQLIPGSGVRERSEWRGDVFYRHHHPLTQLVLIGEGHELLAVGRIASASGLPVAAYMTAEALASEVERNRVAVTLLNGSDLPTLRVDPFTAIVFLLHDRHKETRLLETAATYEPFYLGALGSRRTHATRAARLEADGLTEEQIARVRGPIGLFGPTRTSSALAISVLGEITEARARLDG